MTEYRITAHRKVPAPIEEVFAVISSPAGHAAIDGSGMIVAPEPGDTPSQVGDTFGMKMDRRPLGEHWIRDYEVVNVVTRIEVPRVFEWGVGAFGVPHWGHVFGYELIEDEPGSTTVTSYYDWTDVPEERKARYPVVPLSMIEQTMDNLVALFHAQRSTVREQPDADEH